MIAEKLNDLLAQEVSGVHKPAGFRASEAGYLCARLQYHNRQDWDKRPTPDQQLAGVFGLGRALEDYVSRLLAEAGIRLIKAQVASEDRTMDIVGHVDGFVVLDGKEVPVEVKSASPWTWESVRSWMDMATSQKAWERAWAAQLPLYMWMHNHERGLYLLINKQTGLFKEVEVTLEEAMPLLEDVDAVLGLARAALAKGTPPEPRPLDVIFCSTCWARQVGLCPGPDTAEPPTDIDLAAAEEAASTIVKLREAAKQYEAAQKVLSKVLSAIPVAPGQKFETFLGAVPVRISAYETTRYEVPEDVRKQFAVKVTQRRVEVLG